MTETLHTELPLGDQLMTTDEVAELLRMPVATLRYWRVLDSGPRGFISDVACATAPRRPVVAGRPARVHLVRGGLIHPQERRSLRSSQAIGATAGL